MLFSIIFIIFIVFCDQILKFWIISSFELYQTQPLIPSLLQLTYVQNQGAAWSLFTGKLNLLIIIAILAIIYFSWQLYQARHDRRFIQIIYALIIGGALGNLLDRLLYGHVIDMLELTFIRFPIFNVADIAISSGMVLLGIHLFAQEEGV